MAERPIVLSLCDRTGVMVEPWLAAGYECWIVDMQHDGETHDGLIHRIGADVRTWLPPRRDYAAVFAFPPCTNLSVSGARWFREKGLRGLVDGLEVVEACRRICEWSEAPWLLENPVSTLSTYWRKPDYSFHPWHYGDLESKKTCLWTGGGFVMPPYEVTERPTATRESVWKMAPSPDRGDLRSVTPRGFARAVFQANEPLIRARVA
jgi:hypothetical protein